MPSKKKCNKKGCKKKLTLVDISMPCRCKYYFCSIHRPTSCTDDGKGHACTFDYKEMAKEQLRENMPVATFQKVTAF